MFFVLFQLLNIFVHTIMIAYVEFTLFRMALVWMGFAIFALLFRRRIVEKFQEDR